MPTFFFDVLIWVNKSQKLCPAPLFLLLVVVVLLIYTILQSLRLSYVKVDNKDSGIRNT